MRYYNDKSILIIGGTGTIGTKMVVELLKENPKVIRIFSRDEYKQFVMEKHMNLESKEKLRFLIGDVRDYDRIKRAMKDIDIVFNLAAMKHVPSCEYNPDEAIKTNVIGMENVIRAARNLDVEVVVFASTDKAISPTNTYGATKLLAERLVQSANYNSGSGRTKFITVRFGNVMGSRGSVIPLFKNQIMENRKITITDPEMSRFMMTLSQAALLTMKSVEFAKGGEIFVLKMPVMRLKDLAEVVVEEMCNKHIIDKSEIRMDIIGLRPGEKMYEELMTEEESRYAYDMGDMYMVLPAHTGVENYKEKYEIMKNANTGIYISTDKEPLSKEESRKLIIEEGLI